MAERGISPVMFNSPMVTEAAIGSAACIYDKNPRLRLCEIGTLIGMSVNGGHFSGLGARSYEVAAYSYDRAFVSNGPGLRPSHSVFGGWIRIVIRIAMKVDRCDHLRAGRLHA